MSHPRKPKPQSAPVANDNAPKRRSLNRLPKAELRLPRQMPVQIVEVEVLAELLESLPPIANDNDGDS